MLSRSWFLSSEVFSSRNQMLEVGEAPQHRAPLWHHPAVTVGSFSSSARLEDGFPSGERPV